MFTAAGCKIDRHSSGAYYAVVFVHSIHSRTARSARKRPLCRREGETERASCKKGVIQLVIRPPLTDEMISECPKLASASCDNWMVMYASNANAHADADLPCVFPLVKGLNACKCPHSWLV